MFILKILSSCFLKVAGVFILPVSDSFIGKYPQYVKLAEQLDAYTFNIPQELYDSLEEEEQWAMNQGVLDNAIESGNIVFSNPTSEAVAGDDFSKELQYLKDRGIDVDKIPVIRP